MSDENSIPELDIEFLELNSFIYEIKSFRSSLHLIIKDFQFPSEYYDHSQVDLLIQFPVGYPNTPLDMFWTNPSIKLLNGNIPIRTEHHAEYHGRLWQRWSRHGVWRPGIDSLKNFIRSIYTEINKGV